MKISRKLLAIGLTFLLFFTTAGCGAKSIEMTLNGSILENDYFSIDVSGYEAIRYKRDELPNEQLIGRALAMTYTTEGGKTSALQYVQIYGYKNNETIPNKAYYEMSVSSSGGQLLSFEYINNDPNLGMTAEVLFVSDDGQHHYTFFSVFRAGNQVFKIDIGDKDGTEDRFEGYTTAIDSFKLK